MYEEMRAILRQNMRDAICDKFAQCPSRERPLLEISDIL